MGQVARLQRICGESRDLATESLIETWIDETERRAWFLSEIAGDRPRTRR